MENEFKEIAELAKMHKRVQTLMHYVNQGTIIGEHNRQKEGKATGADSVTKAKYDEELDVNVENLIRKMKAFSYKPQPVRRTYIPKGGGGELRPLGIPAYEDKLVQGVMRRILDEIYEGEFYDFSYGFRRSRNPHKAIHAVNQIIMTKKVNFIVDADIRVITS